MSDMTTLPPIPQSWSALTWQQLYDVWTVKMRYGGNGDVASVAALLALCGLTPADGKTVSEATGEDVYRLTGSDGRVWTATPRDLSHLARQTMPWLQYPYGDPGKEAVKAASKREQNGTGSDSAEREQARPEGKDEQGKVVEEAVEPHRGYVNPNWRDAMELTESEIVVVGSRIVPLSQWRQEDGGIHFALPTVACNNLTWHQYRSLQGLTPLLWQEGQSDDDALQVQAQFLAAMLVPEQMGSESADRFQKAHRFRYDADRSEQSQDFWLTMLRGPQSAEATAVLFYICFQMYQTAMRYYEAVFPLLFHGGGKDDPLRDALTGEVGTINSVMKYQGYTDPQQVYDANLPIILDTLNTMTKEAKEIEKMNQQVKRKK